MPFVDPMLYNLDSPSFDNLAIERLWKRMTTYDGVDTSVFPQYNPNHSHTRPLFFGVLTRLRLTKFVLRHPEEFQEVCGVNFGRPGASAQKETTLRECISDLFDMFTQHSYHVSHGCPHGDFESVSEERGLAIGSFTVFVGFQRTLQCERFRLQREKWIRANVPFSEQQPQPQPQPQAQPHQIVYQAKVVGILPAEDPPPSPPPQPNDMIYQAMPPDPPEEPKAPPPSPAQRPINTIQQPPQEPLVQFESPQRNQEDEPSKEEPESTYDKNDHAAEVVRPESPSSDEEEDDLPTKDVVVRDFTTSRDLAKEGKLLYETNGTCTFVERGPYKVICKTRRRGDTAGSTDAYVYVSRHRLKSGRVIKSKVLRSLRDIDNHFGP